MAKNKTHRKCNKNKIAITEKKDNFRWWMMYVGMFIIPIMTESFTMILDIIKPFLTIP